MASPKMPTEQAVLLQLTDPKNIVETFVNNMAGLGYRDGIVHITLGVIRPRHNTVEATATDESVVASRLAMPMETMAAIANAFGQLQTAIKMQQPKNLN